MQQRQDKSFYKQTTLPDGVVGEGPPLVLPQKIGPYNIEGLLSRGGMSLLYLGVHPETRLPLAIKVLSPQFVTDQESAQRFLKEAQIIALTNHPNIVKLYGQGEWEEGLYIAMELIRGISLRQFITQQSLSLKRSLDIILQVAYALLHLHTHGVIHRDLKPENILITEDGEIKVIDFGIAQLHEEKTSSQTPAQVMGTPDYMSPEQKEASSLVSYSSDIYSLGVIAYELILGKLSYGVINLSLLPKGLRKIIEKSLAISLKERYQDIVDLITDISQYLKSGDLEKDRSGGDQLKELLEILQKTTSALSVTPLPQWPQMDLGLAKQKAIGQASLYLDCFKFPSNTYLLLVAEPTSLEIDSGILLGVFRGMVRARIHHILSSSKESFLCADFAALLNQLLASDTMKLQIRLSLLLLDPLNMRLSFLSCGLSSLFHLPAGSKEIRKLEAQNPLLGSEVVTSFSSAEDNWKEGDILVLPSFNDASFDSLLREAIEESLLLSAQRQAENILKKMLSFSSFYSAKHSKMMLTIQSLG